MWEVRKMKITEVAANNSPSLVLESELVLKRLAHLLDLTNVELASTGEKNAKSKVVPEDPPFEGL